MENDRRRAAELLLSFAPRPRTAEHEEAVQALLSTGIFKRMGRDEPCGDALGKGGVGCVLKGAVRKYWVRRSGQRQIVDLLMPGDFLGLGPLQTGLATDAAASDTRLLYWPSPLLRRLAGAHPAIADLIHDRTADAIARLEAHVLIQGRMTAAEKVGGYLAAMASRLGAEDERITLPVSRYDIADHLGIAVETVSRTISTLARSGSIKLTGPRRIEIRDASLLEDDPAATFLAGDRDALGQAARALPV